MATCTEIISGNELYDDQMAAGEQAIERRDYAAATAHFYRAHSIGHGDKRLHARAHRAIARAGWMRRSPRQFVTHLALFVLTWVF